LKKSVLRCGGVVVLTLLLCSTIGSINARAQPQDPLVIVTGLISGNVVALHPESGGWVELVTMVPDEPPGTGDRPRGIAIGPNQLIYVSLRGGAQNVKRYWWNGSFIDDFIPSFPGPLGPGQIEFTEDGDLIVAGDEYENSSVLRYDGTTGVLLDHFRVDGYTNIVGLLVSDQHVYAGAIQHPVLRFDLSQTPVTGAPFITCCTARPMGMTISHRGTILVTNHDVPLIQEFDATTGNFIATFSDLSSYGITRTFDIAYDAARQRYYVAPFQDGIIELDHAGAVTRLLNTDLLSGSYSLTIATPTVPISVSGAGIASHAAPGVRVVPNPGRGPFTILMDSPAIADEPALARLYDSTGRLVRQLSAVGGLGDGLVWDGRNDQGSLSPAGTYFLNVGTDSGRLAKVVLLR